MVRLRRGARVLILEQVPIFEGDPSAAEAVLEGLEAWKSATARHEALSAQVASGNSAAAQLEALADAADEVEALGGWDQRHRALSFLEHVRVADPAAKVRTMSGGEQRRVALARLLVSAPDLAVLDEPTNHLDAETIEWLERFLREDFRGAVLLITHDRYLLDNVVTRTLEVENGTVHDYDGGYRSFLERKAERQAHAERTEQNRQNFLRRELEWLRRQPKARSTKQSARVGRAEAALSISKPKPERTAEFELDRLATGKTVLEARGLAVEINGVQLVSELDLFVREGERIGIVGPNGVGKTTLLRVLLGEHPYARGQVVLGQKTRIVYLDQQRNGLRDEESVLVNVMGEESMVELGGQLLDPRSYLERFALDRDMQRQPVRSLSGGERARVALARLLRQPGNLVVLDEPTNDLDIATLSALETMLVEQQVTALIVTHDRWFLDRVATAILSFEPGGRVLRYPGNYTTFRRLQDQARTAAIPQQVSEPVKPPARPRGAPKGMSAREKRELEELPERIDQIEAEIARITDKLGEPATYTSGGEQVSHLQRELSSQRAEADRLLARWEELESMR